MNIKKIAASLATIGAMGALLGGATFALFTDTATSTGNTFTTGNADLQIAQNVASPGTYGISILGMNFTDPKIAPGFSETKNFWLKNNSAGTFGMNLTVDFGPSPTIDSLLGAALMISFKCDTNNNGLDGGDPVIGPKSANSWVLDGPVALAAIGAHQSPEVAATTSSDQDELLCQMSANINSSTTGIENQSATFDIVFNGEQAI